jgi:hypothetical protein
LSYSYKKASKKDEEELKEYVEAKAEVQESKTDSKGLQKALEKEGIDYATFANSDEYYRKRVLKDKHADLKLKHGWTYDQPIE